MDKDFYWSGFALGFYALGQGKHKHFRHIPHAALKRYSHYVSAPGKWLKWTPKALMDVKKMYRDKPRQLNEKHLPVCQSMRNSWLTVLAYTSLCYSEILQKE